ncbi:hypothetical protein [Ralstonia pseudosolanacearum]|uniref:Uncharacterized protein n=1 Tax=Ralstonia pseudosolanacearum TaxID=1310165 RepID=A0A454TI77_9RALS|nr:hypothetical protein [Ralstonia pseudosolanacearum]APC69924.1 hypothetical protein RSOE_24365 [Ralstonia solanacearum OE1-1]NKA09806.1 hypothetical protein [Ralstonia solanacearum]API73290.1 hypothetical protein AC251_01175 [Ralstonia pseudosolanacearum]MCK4132773.1 hypothetical protein [Ralstonia pseudosolanacearum]MCK4145220.1 hypothetical protein [Ralstonia pseudosolanacearum]
MAGEIPRVVGAASRVSPGAIAGAPTQRVLHNETPNLAGGDAGPLRPQVHDGLVLSAPAPHEGVSPTRHGELPASRTLDFWGNGRIEGRVRIEGVPAARRVRLFEALTGLLVAEAWSRRDGYYRFDYLDPSRDFFVLAHDHARQFNAVIADWVRPEPTVYP